MRRAQKLSKDPSQATTVPGAQVPSVDVYSPDYGMWMRSFLLGNRLKRGIVFESVARRIKA